MTLLRALQDDDYWRKDDNIGLAVEDVLDEQYWTGIGAWLGEEDVSGRPWILPEGVTGPYTAPWLRDAAGRGTFACGWRGWLRGVPDAAEVSVRVELHDGPPEDDLALWSAVMETPYLCQSGRIKVGARWESESLELDGPGLYRVRVLADRAPGSVHWCLRFWKTDDTDLPRWLKRSEPAVGPACSCREDMMPAPLRNLHQSALAAATDVGGPVELAEILRFLCQPDWQDFDDSGCGTFGSPELDRAVAAVPGLTAFGGPPALRASATFAEYVGLPAPHDVDSVLDLLVTAGLLIREGSGYAAPLQNPVGKPMADLEHHRPLPVEAVAPNPPDTCGHEGRRQHELAEDLAACLIWMETGRRVAVSELAVRLLVREAEVLAALPFCPAARIEPDGLIGCAGHGGEPLLPELDSWLDASERAWPKQERLAVGGPPKAGVVQVDGKVVVQRDGASEVLAEIADDEDFEWCYDGPEDAWETPYGIVLCFGDRTELLHSDGIRQQLDFEPRGTIAVSEDRRHLAGIRTSRKEFREGRRVRRPAELQLIDLVDGSCTSYPFHDAEMVGIFDGRFYCRSLYKGAESWCWQPGSEPVHLPYRLIAIDPLTGVQITADGRCITPDGAQTTFDFPEEISGLNPGGTRIHGTRWNPSVVTVLDLTDPAARPQRHWLPDTRFDASDAIWEDEEHLLLGGGCDTRDGWPPRALRLNTRTGALEQVTACGPGSLRLIRPSSLVRASSVAPCCNGNPPATPW